jgi:hypothetical protein
VITIVHGGQTGVDRGGHDGAIENGWRLSGYMPIERRDELGAIPEDVAKFLVPHDKPGYGARTEANVQSVNAVLIVVRDKNNARETPGTAKTIDLAARRNLPCKIVDPTTDAAAIALWIWSDLLMLRTLLLPLDGLKIAPAPMRLLVAGPRESKWRGARADTVVFLRRIALAIAEIRTPTPDRDLLPDQR